MMPGETEAHDAQAADARHAARSTQPEAPERGVGAARAAAALYLDAWDLNQAEIARLGPPQIPGLGAAA